MKNQTQNSLFTILNGKMRSFAHDFRESSKQLFVDDNGDLIHSGEFGTYREKLTREFIGNFIPQRLGVDTGFLMNSDGKISSQCDIVIYDKSVTPLLKNDNLQTFFPIESVCAIGEVKSKLKLCELKDALLKLANHKSLRDSLYNPTYVNNAKINDIFRDEYSPHLDELDQIFTFLICDSFDFAINKENFEDIAGCYVAGTPKRPISYKHNLILSINNGLVAYLYKETLYQFPLKSKVIQNYGGSDKLQNISLGTNKLSSRAIFPSEGSFEHLRHFCTMLHTAMHLVSTFFPDMSRYVPTSEDVRIMDFDED